MQYLLQYLIPRLTYCMTDRPLQGRFGIIAHYKQSRVFLLCVKPLYNHCEFQTDREGLIPSFYLLCS